MFVSSLMQFNSSSNSLATNARLRWEYAPGSELFVVYNEGRDTRASGLPDLQNRSIVVKVNRLLRVLEYGHAERIRPRGAVVPRPGARYRRSGLCCESLP